jgi:hypothetical protein
VRSVSLFHHDDIRISTYDVNTTLVDGLRCRWGLFGQFGFEPLARSSELLDNARLHVREETHGWILFSSESGFRG